MTIEVEMPLPRGIFIQGLLMELRRRNQDSWDVMQTTKVRIIYLIELPQQNFGLHMNFEIFATLHNIRAFGNTKEYF